MSDRSAKLKRHTDGGLRRSVMARADALRGDAPSLVDALDRKKARKYSRRLGTVEVEVLTFVGLNPHVYPWQVVKGLKRDANDSPVYQAVAKLTGDGYLQRLADPTSEVVKMGSARRTKYWYSLTPSGWSKLESQLILKGKWTVEFQRKREIQLHSPDRFPLSTANT
jgi:hypothetical protein